MAAAFVPVTGGGRRRVFVYGQTRDEASDKLDDLRQAAREHIPRPLDRPTLGDSLDYRLEEVVRPERRASMYNGYDLVRRQLRPVLGRKKLDELAAADARPLLKELRAKKTDGHAGGPRTLSPRMVQFAHAVLRNALSNAVEELVSRNVAKLVKMSTPEYEIGASLDPTAARPLGGDRFVFTTRTGAPISPYMLVKYWHEVRKAAGVPTLRLLRPAAHRRVATRCRHAAPSTPGAPSPGPGWSPGSPTWTTRGSTAGTGSASTVPLNAPSCGRTPQTPPRRHRLCSPRAPRSTRCSCR